MKYIIQWDFEDRFRRYWTGSVSGYGICKKNAKVFPDLQSAEKEADKIHKFRKQGASIRSCQL